jgi:CRP-like cAMP-binding protein
MTFQEVSANGQHNLLYQGLPAAQQVLWNQVAKPVHLRAGDILFEPGDALRHVYFPISSVVSLLGTSSEGECALVATVGYEGIVGLPALFGGEATVRALVQNEGIASRLEADQLVKAFHQVEAVRRHFLRYAQVFVMQIGQAALCNRHHSPEQQLCTLILRTLDRRRQSQLRITHETLAHILGWRRETVSLAAQKLQAAGLLQYARGQISILDREALEGVACECYALVQRGYARLWHAPGAFQDPAGAVLESP